MKSNLENSEFIFIYITCPEKPIAEQIANNLINSNLIACANIFPEITSTYKWNDVVKKDSEVVLILKTVSKNFSSIEKKIKTLHPYECPCILSIPIENGNIEYMDWIKNQL